MSAIPQSQRHSSHHQQSTQDVSLQQRVAECAHTRPEDCYQCGKCSGGCPMAQRMDQLPNQLIRLVQLGQVERALACEAIWQCVSCQTCSTRCPQQVDCAAVMDALRQLAVETEQAAASQKRIWSFQQAFLNNVRRNGRLNELELIGLYKSRSFADDWNVPALFKDSLLAPQLLRRKKLHLAAKKVRNRDVVRRIFERCLDVPPQSGADL